MMFYDVLCLKSILGFLLSERTSGVSPVIFTQQGSLVPGAEVEEKPSYKPAGSLADSNLANNARIIIVQPKSDTYACLG